ncbi:ClpP-like prohead protease/major capsid protein fusion protein [Halomonas ramblicola]|uniref:ClpP-like prohead protease/major capsid protein fusion protein n=1 Tax=Halomonas ramblicola TaxID=747349 RepID=UPI0025B3EC2B|nr:ClpP-like prohead protease/major capsid protein fusion protein [Halomonas ramblicola]MDN3523518.1 Clp protease ClpP [Halomonas ramblicola]
MDLHVYDVIDALLAQQVRSGLSGGKPVTVHINSPGGSVTDALAIYDALRSHKGNVTARVDGLAASAATLIMLAADEVVMAKHSLVMVHNPWTAALGDAGEMRKVAESLDKHAAEMVELYSERTGKESAEIEAIMAQETWFNAEEAVAAGFAHRIDDTDDSKPRLSAAAMAYLTDITERAEALEARREAQVAALFEHLPDTHEIRALKEDSTIMSQSLEKVREEALAALGRNTTPSAAPRRDAGAFADNGNLVGDCMRDALQARLGLAQLQEALNPYRHHSLFEMARAALVDRGESVATMGTKLQVVGAAFTHTTSDFGNLLADTASKSMLRGWEYSGESFQRWCKRGSLTNFHTAHRVGMGGFAPLPEVKEGAEYKYVSTDDRGAPIALATYGGLFSITRQAIINDDLSAFDELPARLGKAASRTIGDLVYSTLTTNPTFQGMALFHANRNNIGTTGALSPGMLSEARHAMRTQKDTQGNPLNISPAFVIVPAQLEGAMMQVLRSTSVPGAETNSGIMNPVANMGELVVESRLDQSNPDQWFVAASQGSDTIEVAYLDGQEQPYLEQQEGWTVDGVSFKVRIDAGVAPLDHRGLFRGQVNE